MVVCLVVLAIRAALRLDGRWDTPLYHLPFAAAYGGLNISYVMSGRIAMAFQGFPPLAHFLQGWLWRLTGSVNATGVINFLAFVTLLAISQRKLKAPFYLFAAIALTTPLVLIHLTVSYVDLFGNSWLALGLLCLFHAYYFERTFDRSILFIGLAGLTAAACTKFQLVPVVAVCLLLYLVVYRLIPIRSDTRQKQVLLWILLAVLLAAVPCKYWPHMQAGVQYCVADLAPMGVLFTGPTMQEFQVIDRSKRELCPAGSAIIIDDDKETSDAGSSAVLQKKKKRL